MEPHGAVVLDRAWNLLRMNAGATRLFGAFCDLAAAPPDVLSNVVLATLHPLGLRPAIVNFDEVAAHILDSGRREGFRNPGDAAMGALRAAIEAIPDLPRPRPTPAGGGPFLPVHLWRGDLEARFFTMITTIGTPIDATAEDIRIETYFPADDATERLSPIWRAPPNEPLRGSRSRSLHRLHRSCPGRSASGTAGGMVSIRLDPRVRLLVLGLAAGLGVAGLASACLGELDSTDSSESAGAAETTPNGNAPVAAASGVVAVGSATPVAPPVPEVPLDDSMKPKEGGPKLGAITLSAVIQAQPDRRSAKIGYLRAGGVLNRGDKPVRIDDCEGGWYAVAPRGFVCASKEATLDMAHPIIKALTRRPDVSKPMPYPYAFVRWVAPNYYRVPTRQEQNQYEMDLDRHLKGYDKNKETWDAVSVGANDIELDAEGNAIGETPDEPPELSYNELYGGSGSDSIPWYFDGGRKIPNIASFKVLDYAIITNRIKRKGGLALIDTFNGPDGRRYALTTDARLVPTSKLKPDRGTTFHGLDLKGSSWHLPLAFVKLEGSWAYDLSKSALDKAHKLDKHEPVQLTGKSRNLGGHRMLEVIDGTYVRERDTAIAAKPSKLPGFSKSKTTRWVDIGIQSQTLILYEGVDAVYATAVSTGRDGLGDPKKTLSTPTGTFRVRDKHVTTTMDSSEVGSQFELRDVPWVQYFKGGVAIHAAPWHDDFGKPRSHGCINMSPIDARRVFLFTEPHLPADWHGVSTPQEGSDEGTIVNIHP